MTIRSDEMMRTENDSHGNDVAKELRSFGILVRIRPLDTNLLRIVSAFSAFRTTFERWFTPAVAEGNSGQSLGIWRNSHGEVPKWHRGEIAGTIVQAVAMKLKES
jgi:hypothetical protein